MEFQKLILSINSVKCSHCKYRVGELVVRVFQTFKKGGEKR